MADVLTDGSQIYTDTTACTLVKNKTTTPHTWGFKVAFVVSLNTRCQDSRHELRERPQIITGRVG